MSENYAGDLTPDAVEKRVEEIWKDVLGMPDGQNQLTFFDLQGQSISAIRVVGRVEDELGLAVDVGILFEDPDLTTFTRAVLSTMEGAAKESPAA